MIRYVSIVFLIGLLSGCQAGEKKPAAEQESPAAAVEAPTAFTLYETFDEFAPLLERQNDTLYVVNFWATWCAPCVEEMPYFETLHQKTKGQKVKVLLVSLDFKKDVEKKLIPFLESRNLAPEVVVLTDGRYNDWIDRVSPEWSGAIPATVFLKSGEKKFYGEQFPDYAALEAIVKGMM